MVSKQLLLKAIAGLTGVATLGLSSLSFAGGDYAPAPAPTPAPVAEEGKAGFYAGVRAGYADTHDFRGINKSNPSVTKLKHNGFAGGINVGYAFNKFFGVEAGYLALPTAKLTTAKTYTATNNVVGLIAGLNNADVSFKRHAFDISAKGTLPIPSIENVGVYGKVGVGFVNTKATANSNSNFVWKNLSIESADSSKYKHTSTTLTYGVGAYWDVTSNIRLDAGWQRWNRQNGKNPNIDTATVGVSYFFGGNELFNS